MAPTDPAPASSPRLTFHDGHQIPQLGYGVYKVDDENAATAVTHALEAGYRHVDTATVYGNERGVGEALRASGIPRSDLFLTTKVWNDDQGYDATLRAFDASLERLGLDTVDLYLIHWPMPMNGQYIDTWKALARLHEEGRATSIGVSNFPAARIDDLTEATGITPVINQVELHPYFAQPQLRVENNKRGIITEAWAPLARGGDLFNDPVISRIANKHDATPAQVVLAWHLAIGNVAIPKSVTPSRIVENFGALGLHLDSEDIAQIDSLDRGLGARTGFDPETMTRS
ncbi:MAG: aldo/keto reductase [Dermabacter sp.]|nr:aldo/keto reductase [Dermabacter sp.]